MGIFTWIMDFIRGSDDEEGLTPLEDEIADRNLKTSEQRQAARRQRAEKRAEERAAKVQARRDYRVVKINAVKEKIYAVASKRKWLFFIIAGVIAAYRLIFKGGFGGGDGGILESIKGFF